jgi:mannose-1-phosphate guanylyltransferase
VIRRFVEKPRPGESASRRINAGLYALSPSILKLIPPGRALSVEREVFPQMLLQGMLSRSFSAKGKPYWNDIGSPAAYLRANLDVLEGRIGLPGFWKGLKGGSVIAKGCKIAPGAVIERSVLLQGCQVGPGARIRGSVLGTACKIGAGASLREGTVLGRGTKITEGSHA